MNELPEDTLKTLLSFLSAESRALPNLAATCHSLEASVLSTAWETVDGSRLLRSCDDIDLTRCIPYIRRGIRVMPMISTLNLAGLERLRGSALVALFVGVMPAAASPSLPSPSSPASASTPEAAPPSTPARRFTTRGRSSPSAASSIRAGSGIFAPALTDLDLSSCSLLLPNLVVSALRGAPTLESLNLTGCHSCLTDSCVTGIVDSLRFASAPRAAPLRVLRLSRSLGSVTSSSAGVDCITRVSITAIFDAPSISASDGAMGAPMLPFLTTLALNNHLTLKDEDLMPLFLAPVLPAGASAISAIREWRGELTKHMDEARLAERRYMRNIRSWQQRPEQLPFLLDFIEMTSRSGHAMGPFNWPQVSICRCSEAR